MIVVYARVSEKKIRKGIPDVVKLITEWFANNPKKKICKAELWQGRLVPVRRTHIEKDIKKTAKEIIAENKKALSK